MKALSSLTVLSACRNLLAVLPPSIRSLAALRVLDLSGNLLAELPSFVCDMSQLQTLAVGSNRLSSLPDAIGNLRALTALHAPSNRLNTLPLSLSQLSLLQVLAVDGNPLQLPHPAIVSAGCAAVRDYCTMVSESAASSKRATVVVCGREGGGKSALLSSLQHGRAVLIPWTDADALVPLQGQPPLSTPYGKPVRKLNEALVEERSARHRVPRQSSSSCSSGSVHLERSVLAIGDGVVALLSCWEVGATDECIAATQLLMQSEHSLHVLAVPAHACNEHDKDTALTQWLDVLQLRAPGTAVLVVLTQCDKLPDFWGVRPRLYHLAAAEARLEEHAQERAADTAAVEPTMREEERRQMAGRKKCGGYVDGGFVSTVGCAPVPVAPVGGRDTSSSVDANAGDGGEGEAAARMATKAGRAATALRADLAALLDPPALEKAAAKELHWLRTTIAAHQAAHSCHGRSAGDDRDAPQIRILESIPCVSSVAGGDASLRELQKTLDEYALTASPPLLPSIGAAVPKPWRAAMGLVRALRDGQEPGAAMSRALATSVTISRSSEPSPTSEPVIQPSAALPAATQLATIPLTELQRMWRAAAPSVLPVVDGGDPQLEGWLRNALRLLAQQGELISIAGQIYLNPTLLTGAICPLLELDTEDTLDCADFVQRSTAIADRRATQTLREAVAALSTVGELREALLPFLWRGLPQLLTEDYEAVLHTLCEVALIFPVPLPPSLAATPRASGTEPSSSAGEATKAWGGGGRRWIVPLRLPLEPDPVRLAKLWPLTPSGGAPVGLGPHGARHTALLRGGCEHLFSVRFECSIGSTFPGCVLQLERCPAIGQPLLCWRRGILLSDRSVIGALAMLRVADRSQPEDIKSKPATRKATLAAASEGAAPAVAEMLTEGADPTAKDGSGSGSQAHAALLVEVRGTASQAVLWRLLMRAVDTVHSSLAAAPGVQYAVLLSCPHCNSVEKSLLGRYAPRALPGLFDLDTLLQDQALDQYCKTCESHVELRPAPALVEALDREAADEAAKAVAKEVAAKDAAAERARLDDALKKLETGQGAILSGQSNLAEEARKINRAVAEVHVDVKRVHATLSHVETMLSAQSQMLGTLLRGEYDCPPYFVMAPADLSHANVAKKFIHVVQPRHWVGKPVDLQFVDPVTMLAAGDKYRVELPRDCATLDLDPRGRLSSVCPIPIRLSLTTLYTQICGSAPVHAGVRKYGPALQTSLRVLSVAATVARAAFVLCPDLTELFAEAATAVADVNANFTGDFGAGAHTMVMLAMEQSLGEEMSDEGLGNIGVMLGSMTDQLDTLHEVFEAQTMLSAIHDLATMADNKLGEALDADGGDATSRASGAPAATSADPPEELIRESYGYVKRIIGSQDEGFARSGLVMVVADKACPAAWTERYLAANVKVSKSHSMGDGSVAWVGREWAEHYARVGRPLLGISTDQQARLLGSVEGQQTEKRDAGTEEMVAAGTKVDQGQKDLKAATVTASQTPGKKGGCCTVQ